MRMSTRVNGSDDNDVLMTQHVQMEDIMSVIL